MGERRTEPSAEPKPTKNPKPGESSPPSDDPPRRRSPFIPTRLSDRWTLSESVLALLAAALTLTTAGLGVIAASTASERDELATTADSLVDERDVLRDDRDQLAEDLDAAEALIEDLEEAEASASTTLVPDDSDGPDNPGAPLPGGSTFLNQLDPVAGNPSTEETELAGERYRDVVRQGLRSCDGTANPDIVEYNLGAGYERFTALAGLHDTVEDSADIWRFSVTTIDGNGEHVVFEDEIHFAAPVEVDVPIAGARRLRLTVREVDVDGQPGCYVNNYVAVWANPKLT